MSMTTTRDDVATRIGEDAATVETFSGDDDDVRPGAKREKRAALLSR